MKIIWCFYKREMTVIIYDFLRGKLYLGILFFVDIYDRNELNVSYEILIRYCFF